MVLVSGGLLLIFHAEFAEECGDCHRKVSPDQTIHAYKRYPQNPTVISLIAPRVTKQAL